MIRAALLWFLLALPSAAQDIAGFPVHGNWCGIGHGGLSGGVWNPPPIDPIDAACMRHDQCTALHGRLDCGCDVLLMRELRALPYPHPAARDLGRAIYDAIAVMPCDSPGGQAAKAEMFVSDWTGGVLSGREGPWEVLRRWSALGRDGIGNSYWRGW